jgi:hypothetical protein
MVVGELDRRATIAPESIPGATPYSRLSSTVRPREPTIGIDAPAIAPLRRNRARRR